MGGPHRELRKYPRSQRGFVGVEDRARPGVLNQVDNISCSGILCRTLEPMPVMTKMRIVLELPEPFNQRIETDGVVVRCDLERMEGDYFNVAILYQNLDGDAYELIKDYVEHDLAQAGEVES